MAGVHSDLVVEKKQKNYRDSWDYAVGVYVAKRGRKEMSWPNDSVGKGTNI